MGAGPRHAVPGGDARSVRLAPTGGPLRRCLTPARQTLHLRQRLVHRGEAVECFDFEAAPSPIATYINLKYNFGENCLPLPKSEGISSQKGVIQERWLVADALGRPSDSMNYPSMQWCLQNRRLIFNTMILVRALFRGRY